MTATSDVITLRERGTGDDRSITHEWCPIERSLKGIGTNSALRLLPEVFWGARRFEDLARKADITEQMAAIRLKQLVEAGILTKQPYREPGQRTWYEYVLSSRGRELFPVIVSLIEFGLLLQGDSKRSNWCMATGAEPRLFPRSSARRGTSCRWPTPKRGLPKRSTEPGQPLK
jgi:DNA-binding HxlR family transcriptional regulator